MATLHVVDLAKVKVEVELRLGLSGGLDDVAGKVRLLADALAGRMVEGEALADADEQLAKAREDLASLTLDLDRVRTELGDARATIASLEKQLSSTAGIRGSPPRGPDVLAVEDVQDSPAAVKVAGPPSSTEAVAGDVVSTSNEQKEPTDQAEQSAAATAHGAGTPDSGSENAADKNASGEVSNDVSEAPALPGLAPPPKKKPRNVPATCIVPGCTLPGSSRKQWCCPGHGATLSLTERQSLLAAWKRLNKQEAARAVA